MVRCPAPATTAVSVARRDGGVFSRKAETFHEIGAQPFRANVESSSESLITVCGLDHFEATQGLLVAFTKKRVRTTHAATRLPSLFSQASLRPPRYCLTIIVTDDSALFQTTTTTTPPSFRPLTTPVVTNTNPYFAAQVSTWHPPSSQHLGRPRVGQQRHNPTLPRCSTSRIKRRTKSSAPSQTVRSSSRPRGR